MKRITVIAIFICVAALAASGGALQLRYTRDSAIFLPKDYREWIYLSSGLNMTYNPTGAAPANPRFENVFVNPEAYRAFLKAGMWPDKTILILEIRNSAGQLSINKDGRVQTDVAAIEAHVKDASHGGWAFYRFNENEQSGALIPKTADCYSCHEQNGAVDTTFVQFYPTLAKIEKGKGLFKTGK